MHIPKTSPWNLVVEKGRGVLAVVEGEGISLRHRGRRDVPPMFAMRRFRFEVDIGKLFEKPIIVRQIALTGYPHTFFSSKALGHLLERSLALAAPRRWSGPPASFVAADGSPSLVDVRHSRSGFPSADAREARALISSPRCLAAAARPPRKPVNDNGIQVSVMVGSLERRLPCR